MRVLKYFSAIWVALLFYSVSSILVGAMGLDAYKQLNEQRIKQIENLTKLKSTNEELLGLREALNYDYDTIAVYARALGFGTSDERFIKIVGVDEKQTKIPDAGEIVNTTALKYVEDKTLRIISIVIALSMAGCIAIVDVLQFIRNA
ncbi:MAG: hypothetical protein Ta2F_04440 [Termitinemataceae bacterium]|nr:MAG: hypothetical protein Ta2F_04440 [Termitinemataceae bacterium]